MVLILWNIWLAFHHQWCFVWEYFGSLNSCVSFMHFYCRNTLLPVVTMHVRPHWVCTISPRILFQAPIFSAVPRSKTRKYVWMKLERVREENLLHHGEIDWSVRNCFISELLCGRGKTRTWWDHWFPHPTHHDWISTMFSQYWWQLTRTQSSTCKWVLVNEYCK